MSYAPMGVQKTGGDTELNRYFTVVRSRLLSIWGGGIYMKTIFVNMHVQNTTQQDTKKNNIVHKRSLFFTLHFGFVLFVSPLRRKSDEKRRGVCFHDHFKSTALIV